MRARRARMRRVLPPVRIARALGEGIDAPRRMRRGVIDFSSLPLPMDVRLALADAFWNHLGGRSDQQVMTLWAQLRVFVRFAAECGLPQSLADVDSELLARYVEWLNAQRRRNGQPWSKSSRAGAYTTLRKLLQWLIRCRPGTLQEVHFPYNPFPYRNRDSGRVGRLPARDLRAILKACEKDIMALRALRERAERERAAASSESDPLCPLSWLLSTIDEQYRGIVPAHLSVSRAGHHQFRVHYCATGAPSQSSRTCIHAPSRSCRITLRS